MNKSPSPINSKAVIGYCYQDKAYQKALKLAEKLYAKVKRVHTGLDYLSHPLTVATLLLDVGVSSEAMQASALQDTLTKTTLKLSTIQAEFGTTVAQMVQALTPVQDASGQLDVAACKAALAAAGPEVQTIKLASLLDEVCAIPKGKLVVEAARIEQMADLAASLTFGNAELARRVQAAVRRARA